MDIIRYLNNVWNSVYQHKPLHRQIGKKISSVAVEGSKLVFRFEGEAKPTCLPKDTFIQSSKNKYSRLIGRTIISADMGGSLSTYHFDRLYTIWIDERDGTGSIERKKND